MQKHPEGVQIEGMKIDADKQTYFKGLYELQNKQKQRAIAKEPIVASM